MKTKTQTDGKTSTESVGVTETQQRNERIRKSEGLTDEEKLSLTREKKEIKYYYIILNDGLNLATPSKERALERLGELFDLMKMEKNKNWEVKLSYGN